MNSLGWTIKHSKTFLNQLEEFDSKLKRLRDPNFLASLSDREEDTLVKDGQAVAQLLKAIFKLLDGETDPLSLLAGNNENGHQVRVLKIDSWSAHYYIYIDEQNKKALGVRVTREP